MRKSKNTLARLKADAVPRSYLLGVLITGVFLSMFSFTIDAEAPQEQESPLVGAWFLISGKYYTADRDSLLGTSDSPDQPSQIKVFSENHFAYVSRGDEHSAGPYKIEGNRYIETHNWSSYEIAVGATSTYEFRISGDTLFMSGPLESVYRDGTAWDDHIQMDEIRIRAN